MHILIVNNIYPPIMAGGAELIVAWLSEDLVARGHRVTVVSTCGPEMQPYPVEERNGVTVIRFFPANLYWNFARGGQKRHRRMLWHLRDAWNMDAARKFHDIIRAAKPDVIHTHLIDGLSASIWRIARRAGIPVVHTAHDYHLVCPRAFLLTRQWRICRHPGVACRLYRTWHLQTTRHVDLFVSPSHFLLQHHQLAGLRGPKTAVVANGIPLPADGACHRETNTGSQRFLLLSRLTVEKGVRIVLQAIALLSPELKFELVVAGRGALEQEVRDAAARDPRIRFVGYVTGSVKDELLRSAQFLLIPSLWYENAPVSVIEAAAYGLAVVASRIGGLPELVREGNTGLLFEPGDARGLATILSGLVNGNLTLPDLPRASRLLAQSHSVARMTDAYLQCYHDVMASRDRAPASSLNAPAETTYAD